MGSTGQASDARATQPAVQHTKLNRELAQMLRGGVIMDVTVRRNAYGRQLGSFRTSAPFAGEGEIPMTFIRAPYISEVGAGVEVLAEVDCRIVAVRQSNQIACAFHPELDGDPSIHRLLLDAIA